MIARFVIGSFYGADHSAGQRMVGKTKALKNRQRMKKGQRRGRSNDRKNCRSYQGNRRKRCRSNRGRQRKHEKNTGRKGRSWRSLKCKRRGKSLFKRAKNRRKACRKTKTFLQSARCFELNNCPGINFIANPCFRLSAVINRI